jgi:hypothetical protein
MLAFQASWTHPASGKDLMDARWHNPAASAAKKKAEDAFEPADSSCVVRRIQLGACRLGEGGGDVTNGAPTHDLDA